LRIRATREAIEIREQGAAPEPLFLRLPEGVWTASLLREDGSVLREARLRQRESDGALRLSWGEAAGARLVKASAAPTMTKP
jgi:hypothetical protein